MARNAGAARVWHGCGSRRWACSWVDLDIDGILWKFASRIVLDCTRDNAAKIERENEPHDARIVFCPSNLVVF